MHSSDSEVGITPAAREDEAPEIKQVDPPLTQGSQPSSSEEEGEIDENMETDSDDYEPPDPSPPARDLRLASSSLTPDSGMPPPSSYAVPVSPNASRQQEDSISPPITLTQLESPVNQVASTDVAGEVNHPQRC